MTDIAQDPTQAEVDRAVAEAVAASGILTEPSTDPVGALTPRNPDPSERLRVALARRSAWRSALASLRSTPPASVDGIRAAIVATDADAIVKAVTDVALTDWIAANLGVNGSMAHGLNAVIEQEVVASIYGNAPAILASLADQTADETTEYLRGHAIAATTPDAQRFDIFGRPTMPRVPTLSGLSTVVPR
jgi:hypothetical protein